MDVLKKLPGFSVDENGSINIFGRDLDVLLIEGSDLFGANYKLATQNIRSNVIAEVEVIERHSNNPVLASIHNEDLLAINLKLKVDFKNIISGSVYAGPGIGDELKGLVHGNIFRISKKSKWVGLSDMGNTGTQYNTNYVEFRDVGQATLLINRYSLRVGEQTISSGGLSRELTDNGQSYLNNIRSEHQIGRHTLKVSVLSGLNRDKQVESFRGKLSDQFVNEYDNKLKLSNSTLDGFLEHLYLDQSKTISVRTNVAIAWSRHRSNSQIYDFNLSDYLVETWNKARSYLLNNETSWKLNEHFGIQWITNFNNIIDKNQYGNTNDLWSSYFFDDTSGITQSVSSDIQQISSNLRILRKLDDYLHSGTIGYQQNVSSIRVHQQSIQSERQIRQNQKSTLTFPQLQLYIGKEIGKHIWSLGSTVIHDDLQFDNYTFDSAWLWNYWFKYRSGWIKSWQWNVLLKRTEARPDLFSMLTPSYLVSPIRIDEGSMTDFVEKQFEYRGSVAFSPVLKQWSILFSSSAEWGVDKWAQTIEFVDDHLFGVKYFKALNGRAIRLGVDGRYNIPQWTMVAAYRFNYGWRSNDRDVEEQTFRQKNRSMMHTVHLDKAVGFHLRFNNEIRYAHSMYMVTDERVPNLNYTIADIRWRPSISYSRNQLEISFAADYRHFIEPRSSTVIFGHVGIEKNLKLNNRLGSIGIKVNNLQANSDIAYISTDGLFEYSQSLEVIEPFVLLTIDVGF